MSIDKTHIIVVGNEKGGAGKTTTSVHLIVSLLKLGFKVASIDVDSSQQSLTSYLNNRQKTKLIHGTSIQTPTHYVILESRALNIKNKSDEEKENFDEVFNEAKEDHDFIIIDTPGSNTYLSRLAHSYADTVITPINDSFVDMDVLAKIDGEKFDIEKPSTYSQMLWEQKMERAKREQTAIDWIVIRNRLSHLDAKNKRRVEETLEKLSKRVGFRCQKGFSERVIFRELFLQGLTLLDVGDNNFDISISLSHIAAKQELMNLVKSLNNPKIDKAFANNNELEEV